MPNRSDMNHMVIAWISIFIGFFHAILTQETSVTEIKRELTTAATQELPVVYDLIMNSTYWTEEYNDRASSITEIKPELQSNVEVNQTKTDLKVNTSTTDDNFDLNIAKTDDNFDLNIAKTDANFDLNIAKTDDNFDLNIAKTDDNFDLNIAKTDAMPELNIATTDAMPELNIATTDVMSKLNIATTDAMPELNIATTDAMSELNIATTVAMSELNIATTDAKSDLNIATTDAMSELNIATTDAKPDVNVTTTDAKPVLNSDIAITDHKTEFKAEISENNTDLKLEITEGKIDLLVAITHAIPTIVTTESKPDLNSYVVSTESKPDLNSYVVSTESMLDLNIDVATTHAKPKLIITSLTLPDVVTTVSMPELNANVENTEVKINTNAGEKVAKDAKTGTTETNGKQKEEKVMNEGEKFFEETVSMNEESRKSEETITIHEEVQNNKTKLDNVDMDTMEDTREHNKSDNQTVLQINDDYVTENLNERKTGDHQEKPSEESTTSKMHMLLKSSGDTDFSADLDDDVVATVENQNTTLSGAQIFVTASSDANATRVPKRILENQNRFPEARARPARPDPGYGYYKEGELSRPYRPDSPSYQWPYYRSTPDYRTMGIYQDTDHTRPARPDPEYQRTSYRNEYGRPSQSDTEQSSGFSMPYRPSFARPYRPQGAFARPYQPDYKKPSVYDRVSVYSRPTEDYLSTSRSDVDYSIISRSDYEHSRPVYDHTKAPEAESKKSFQSDIRPSELSPDTFQTPKPSIGGIKRPFHPAQDSATEDAISKINKPQFTDARPSQVALNGLHSMPDTESVHVGHGTASAYPKPDSDTVFGRPDASYVQVKADNYTSYVRPDASSTYPIPDTENAYARPVIPSSYPKSNTDSTYARPMMSGIHPKPDTANVYPRPDAASIYPKPDNSITYLKPIAPSSVFNKPDAASVYPQSSQPTEYDELRKDSDASNPPKVDGSDTNKNSAAYPRPGFGTNYGQSFGHTNQAGHFTPGAFLPENNLTRVEGFKADCFDSYMKVTIRFNGTFNGLIYSTGYFQDPTCSYVNGSGRYHYEFIIRLNRCGTLGKQEIEDQSSVAQAKRRQERTQYLVNSVTIQYNPLIEEEIDEHFKVTCEYGYDFWKTVTFPVLSIESSGSNYRAGTPVVFTLPPPQIVMEIRSGYGPSGNRITGPVKVGDPLSLVIHMKSESTGFDILVSNCLAHNGAEKRMQLIDTSGCVVQDKVISNFRGLTNPDRSFHVTLFSFVKAFRFTGSPALYIECDVHMCHGTCPPQRCYWRHLHKRSIENDTSPQPMDESRGVISESVSLFQALEVRHEEVPVSRQLPVKQESMTLQDELCLKTITFSVIVACLLVLLIASTSTTVCLHTRVRQMKRAYEAPDTLHFASFEGPSSLK